MTMPHTEGVISSKCQKAEAEIFWCKSLKLAIIIEEYDLRTHCDIRKISIRDMIKSTERHTPNNKHSVLRDRGVPSSCRCYLTCEQWEHHHNHGWEWASRMWKGYRRSVKVYTDSGRKKSALSVSASLPHNQLCQLSRAYISMQWVLESTAFMKVYLRWNLRILALCGRTLKDQNCVDPQFLCFYSSSVHNVS
jgi:hypothetical protein